jgi:hypothetical protein
MSIGAFTTCECGNFMHHGRTCSHCGKLDGDLPEAAQPLRPDPAECAITKATCAFCGWTDYSGIFEDCCSRPMCVETSDVAEPEPDFEHEFEEAIANFEDELAADAGNEPAAIRLWMRGQPLPPVGRAIIDNLSHGNRLALLATIYSSEAA